MHGDPNGIYCCGGCRLCELPGVFLPFVSQKHSVIEACGFRISWVQLLAILLVVFLSWVNSKGLHTAAKLQNLLGFAKITALFGLIGFGVTTSHGNWANFQPFAPEALTAGVLTGFAIAMSKVLFAYDSWNVVTFVSEETHDPVRTLPRALFLGTLGVTLVYALTNAAYLHVLPVELAAKVPDQRIAAEVASIVLGPIGLSIIAAAILVSTAGCVNGLILSGGPWLYHAMAKDGLFFQGAARIDPVSKIPARSIQFQAIWAVFLILSGSVGTRGARSSAAIC